MDFIEIALVKTFMINSLASTPQRTTPHETAPDLAVFGALAKSTNYASRAGAIPFWYSKDSGELEAKKTWKFVTLLKELVLFLQILFMWYQAFHFAQAKDLPLIQRIHVFYTALVTSLKAYNVRVIYRDPRTFQTLFNNLIRINHHFNGRLRPNLTSIVSKAVHRN